jgi:hypothetical protein
VGRNAEPGAVFRRGAFAAALMCLLTGPAAAQQAGPTLDQSIAGLCRSYASGIRDVSPESSFDFCMRQRGCSIVPGTAQYTCEAPGLQPRHGGGDDG